VIWNGRYLLDDNYGTTGGTSSDTIVKTMMVMMMMVVVVTVMVVAVNAFQRSLSVVTVPSRSGHLLTITLSNACHISMYTIGFYFLF